MPHYACPRSVWLFVPFFPSSQPQCPAYSRQCPSGPHLTGWQCPMCTVDSAPVCPCLTGCLCPLYVQLTSNLTDRGHTQQGTGALSYRGHRQLVSQGHKVGHCQLYIQRAPTASQTGAHSGYTGALSTAHSEGTDNQSVRVHTVGTLGQSAVHSEGTDNQTGRGHTLCDTLGHCQLYIQRAQTTSQTGGTQWGTVIQRAQATSQSGAQSGALSTVHTEGTYSQSDRGTQWVHWGLVYCTFRGHRQPVSEGAHSGHTGAVSCTFRGHRQPDRQGAHIV